MPINWATDTNHSVNGMFKNTIAPFGAFTNTFAGLPTSSTYSDNNGVSYTVDLGPNMYACQGVFPGTYGNYSDVGSNLINGVADGPDQNVPFSSLYQRVADLHHGKHGSAPWGTITHGWMGGASATFHGSPGNRTFMRLLAFYNSNDGVENTNNNCTVQGEGVAQPGGSWNQPAPGSAYHEHVSIGKFCDEQDTSQGS
tara:strand:- start:34 stop:627 length:594 start_codon:yes stop_codon:yes gene_type:complete